MTRAVSLAALVAALPLAAPDAQVVVNSPNFSVELLSADVPASGSSMAIDRSGNAFVVDKNSPAQDAIVVVQSSGVVLETPSSDFGTLGQVAHHPLNGSVYVVDTSPVFPVLQSTVWRLTVDNGPQLAFRVDVSATGLAINNAGTFFLGGTGIAGPGLYSVSNPAPSANVTATFRSPGFGLNERLTSLVSGDVLIASGDAVERWSPLSATTQPFYDHPGPFPNDFAFVVGSARNPMNQLGSGAIVGVRDLAPFGFGGTGLGVATDLAGNVLPSLGAAFLTEEYNGFQDGLLAIAAGIQQDLYWLTDTCNSACAIADPPNRLFRIRQQPGVGSQGSLFASATATSASFELYGPPAGGDPFLLGLELAGIIVNQTYLPPWGLLGIVPGGFGYVGLLDGIGITGTPNPFAVIPPGGTFEIDFPVPAGLSGLTFRFQNLILAPDDAPNGFFFISNEAQLTMP